MDTEKHIKSISNDYREVPFFSFEKKKRKRDRRFVAYFNNKNKIKDFIKDFANTATSFLDIQLRIMDDERNPMNYNGRILKRDWQSIFSIHEEIILNDGCQELMILIPETQEYIAFDDHGLIYIYTQEKYRKKLEDLGLVFKRRPKFIFDQGHWHIRPANAEEKFQALVDEMDLKLDV